MTRRSTLRGFTLIELLVVLAILGILTTAVVLSITIDPRRAAISDVKQLSLLLEAAMIEAQAGRRQLAWSANAEGYEFWEAQTPNEHDRRWQPLTADDRFQAHRFAPGLHLVRLDVDGQSLPQGALLVFRRGDPSLFRIALAGPQGQSGQVGTIELRGLPTGRVDILNGAGQ
ncbi:MAG: type II secretion system protein [Sterolibacterium sp.]